MTWTVEACESCGGSGWDYCHRCEMPCDHDELCRACKGYNWLPVRITDQWKLLAIQHFARWELFRTKRAAFASIEYDSLA